jgi:alkylated DNA repair dioxygenase AlkB
MPDLFATAGAAEPWDEIIARGSVLLRDFALLFVDNILVVLGDITAQAPFRHMTTPWGAAMSVAMTNCGEAGWLTDRTGYRYDRVDPKPASRGRSCRSASASWRAVPRIGPAIRVSCRMRASSTAMLRVPG